MVIINNVRNEILGVKKDEMMSRDVSTISLPSQMSLREYKVGN